MLISILLVVLLILLATAGLLGWTTDSRDVEFGLWPLTRTARCRADGPPDGARIRASNRRDLHNRKHRHGTAPSSRPALTHCRGGLGAGPVRSSGRVTPSTRRPHVGRPV